MNTLIRFNLCVNPLVYFQLIRTGETLGTEGACVGSDSCMRSVVDFQLIRSRKTLFTSGAFKWFNIEVGDLVHTHLIGA